MRWAKRIWDIYWNWPTTFVGTVVSVLVSYFVLAGAICIWLIFSQALSLVFDYHAPTQAAYPTTGFLPLDVLIGLRPFVPLLWANHSRKLGFFTALAGLLAALLVMLPDVPDLFYGLKVEFPPFLFISMVLVLWLLVRATDAWEAWRAKRARA
jgi:hypothetical protein